MSKSSLIATITAVVVIGAAIATTVALIPHTQAQTATTATAGLHDVVQQVTATGQVEATHTTNLAFGTGGVINHVFATKGESVSTGQIIATLDASDTAALVAGANAALVGDQSTTQTALQNALTAQANTAKVNAAAVAVAKQKILNTKATLKITQDIFSNVDSDSDIDKTSVTYITAAQALASAQAAYNDAQTGYQNAQAQSKLSSATATSAVTTAQTAAQVKQPIDKSQLAYQSAVLNKSVLRAPSAGTITNDSNLQIGQYASAGQTVGTMISQQLQITTQVPESDVAQLKPGMTASITLDALGANKTFAATIATIDPAATITNDVASYGVTLQFSGATDQIKTGMTANITIPTATINQTLAVPSDAIVMNGNNAFVFTPTSNNKPAKHAVTIGLKGTNGFTQITSGLSAGDQIISFGTQISN